MKKYLLILLAMLALVPATESFAQNKNKQIETLKRQLDSLQQAYDQLFNDYQSVIEPVNSEGDDIIEDDEILHVNPEDYTPEGIDSLLNLYYVQKMMDANEFNMESIDRDSLTSNIPDSVYIARLQRMGSFIPVQFNRYVKNSIITYTEKLSKIGKIIGLSSYYFPIIEEILDEYGLPLELRAVAIIESAFNPKAVSRARAKGMWQFMASTGKRYGLQMTSFVDERYDPVASCRAAAQYMKDSYMIFGDWALAIASYNCGAGNVNKAIRRSGGKTDFWEIYDYLPRETRGYIPAFIAALYTMQYYREHGIVPEPISLPASVDTFHINKMLHFQQVSDVVGIPIETLRDINPQYLHDIVPGTERTYILNIPASYTGIFAEKEDEIYAYKDTVFFSNKAITKIKETGGSDGQRIAHKVKSGETLGSIARRYHVTVNNIKSWNGLRSNTIRVGQRLYIYGKASGSSSSSSSTASSGSSSSSSKSSGTSTSNGYVTYKVKSGDTLSKIASRYGVSLSTLYNLNNLNSKSKIYPGMTIRVKKAQ